MPETPVGIFWLLRGKLLIDSTPLSKAEPYGDYLTHRRGHAEVWARFQRSGAAPIDIEYEEPPRGRVMYNTQTRWFTLLADKCILRDKGIVGKGIVGKIMSALKLPKTTKTGTDDHYKCSQCLHGISEDLL